MSNRSSYNNISFNEISDVTKNLSEALKITNKNIFIKTEIFCKYSSNYVKQLYDHMKKSTYFV